MTKKKILCELRVWTKGDVMLAYEVMAVAFKTWCGAELNYARDNAVTGQRNQSKERSV